MRFPPLSQEPARDLEGIARRTLIAEGVSTESQTTEYQVDLRYRGQGMRLTISVTREEFVDAGLEGIAKRFDEMHTQLFTFALDAPHEVVNLRAVVQGPETLVRAEQLKQGGTDAAAAIVEQTTLFVDGKDHPAKIYDRAKLLAGNRISGPAIVSQMDTTTLILPGHTGEVDAVGNILIRPNV